MRHPSQAPAGPSQREQRAQLRAERLEQKTARHLQDTDDMLDDADANELEAAASLVDLMAHEALQETGMHFIMAKVTRVWMVTCTLQYSAAELSYGAARF